MNEKNEHPRQAAVEDPVADHLLTPEEAAALAEEDARDSAPDLTPPDDGAEIAELKDKLLRALADMENLRRRGQKDREDALKYAASNFARDMLPVADNLRRAIDSLPDQGEAGIEAMKSFIEGIALTERELLSTLERHGIRKIEPMGEKFDPQFHEAMFEAPVPGAEPGTVFQVLEAGYVVHDRLLRPAKVGIARAAPAAADPGEQTDTTA